MTNDELVALTAQQWDQLTLDQRVALLPEVGNSRLKPAFASLQSEVKANVLRLGRQQQLPSPGPTVSVTEDGDVAEGGTAGFTVTADPAPTSALSVTVNVTQSGDYGVTPASHTVTVATTGTGTLTVLTTDDGVDESDGSVTVAVAGGSGYTVSPTAGTATVAVTDDPPTTRLPPSQVSFSAEDASATEGETLSFRVVLSAAANARVRVYWRTRYSYAGAHSAFPDVDYPSRVRGWLAFEPGEVEKSVAIALPNDTVAEPAEVFQIYLSFTEGGATIADRDATMTGSVSRPPHRCRWPAGMRWRPAGWRV